LGTQDNIAMLQLSPGYTKYEAFCAEAEIPSDYDRNPIIAMDTGVVSNNKGDSDGKDKPWKPLVHERENKVRQEQKGVDQQEQEDSDNAPDESQQHTTDFDLNGPAGSSEQCQEVNLIEDDMGQEQRPMPGGKLNRSRHPTYQPGSRTPADPPSDGTCPPANATQKLPRTNVHCLYVREGKQKGMEEQGNQGATSQSRNETRGH
jgi:hypothetical protein